MKVNYLPGTKTSSFLPPLEQLGAQGTPQPQQPATPPNQAPVADQFTDLDPIMLRQKMALDQMQQGSDMSPARGGLAEGFARLATAVSGGMRYHDAAEQYKEAKQGNKQALLNAFDQGDVSQLLASGDPTGEKLGSVILESRLKRIPTHQIIGGEDAVALGFPKGSVVDRSIDGETRVLYRPNMGAPRGYEWNEDNSEMVPIKGGPADPDVIQRNAGKRRAPPKPGAVDQSGLKPWERKW